MLRSEEMGSTVIDLRVYRDPSYTPVIVLVDLQQEYVSRHRALNLSGTEKVLSNCRRLIQVARDRGYPLAFMRWTQNSKFFGSSEGYVDWIEGFTPRGSDMVFEHSMPSCYTNEHFERMMTGGGGDNAILAGFTGTIACLSTVVDAYSRGHNITFVTDASASHAVDSCTESQTHELASQIISLYCPITMTEQWVSEQTYARQKKKELRRGK